MAWVKLDDQFPDHRKLAELGAYAPLCGWLYVCGLAYCNRQLTDGLIPKAHVTRLAGFEHLSVETGEIPGMASFGETIETRQLADLLVQAGLWEDAGHQYRVHDYLDYQPSRESVIQERNAVSERKRKWQERRRNGVTGSVPNAVPNAIQNGGSTPLPDPDPDPVSSKNEESVRARLRPLVAKRNGSAEFEHPRFDVPTWWHLEAVKGLSDGERRLMAFYRWLVARVERTNEDTLPRKEWLNRCFAEWLAETKDERGGLPLLSDVVKRLDAHGRRS